MIHKLSLERLQELMEQATPEQSAVSVLEAWKQEHDHAIAEYVASQKELASTMSQRHYDPPPPPPAWVQELKRDNMATAENDDKMIRAWSKRQAEEEKARASRGMTTTKTLWPNQRG